MMPMFKLSETLRGRSSAPSRFPLLLILSCLLVLCGCSTVPRADNSGPIPIPANLTATPLTLECLRLPICSRPISGNAKPTASNSPIS